MRLDQPGRVPEEQQQEQADGQADAPGQGTHRALPGARSFTNQYMACPRDPRMTSRVSSTAILKASCILA